MILESPRTTTGWGIGLTNTFRNTSHALLKSKGHFKGFGSNLQNPSDRICRLHVPDKGKIFIQADQSGAEALIVAYLCRAGNYRKLFTHGIKPHTYIALHAFYQIWYQHFDVSDIVDLCKLDIPDIPSHPAWKKVSTFIKDYNQIGGQGLYYFLGKKSAHSFNYKKQPATFIFDILKESEGKIVLPLEEGRRIYGIYHGLFPEITEWHTNQEKLLRVTRELRNLFGYPRKFYGTFTDEFFREAISFIPQSTVGTITNVAFCKMQTFIEDNKRDWDLLNNKHDSILLQVPVEEKFEAAKLLTEMLCCKLQYNTESFQMKSEVSCGFNWGKSHPTENPDGLEEMKV